MVTLHFLQKMGGFLNSKQSQLSTCEDSDLGSELDCSGLMESDDDSKTVTFTNKIASASVDKVPTSQVMDEHSGLDE